MSEVSNVTSSVFLANRVANYFGSLAAGLYVQEPGIAFHFMRKAHNDVNAAIDRYAESMSHDPKRVEDCRTNFKTSIDKITTDYNQIGRLFDGIRRYWTLGSSDQVKIRKSVEYIEKNCNGDTVVPSYLRPAYDLLMSEMQKRDDIMSNLSRNLGAPELMTADEAIAMKVSADSIKSAVKSAYGGPDEYVRTRKEFGMSEMKFFLLTDNISENRIDEIWKSIGKEVTKDAIFGNMISHFKDDDPMIDAMSAAYADTITERIATNDARHLWSEEVV